MMAKGQKIKYTKQVYLSIEVPFAWNNVMINKVCYKIELNDGGTYVGTPIEEESSTGK